MLKKLIGKYRDMILYIFFGGCTTLINILVYFVCARAFSMGTAAANIAAWVLSVLFAYATNRTWVFHSTERSFSGILREMAGFFASRAATGALDIGVMYLSVDIMHFPDMAMKIISNIVVIVLNYVLSRLLVFRKK